ncbi:hypothetical protein [Maricaulis sp. CAU 1757]
MMVPVLGLVFTACSPKSAWTEYREVFPGHAGSVVLNGKFSRYDDLSMVARDCSEETGLALCLQGPITFALPHEILSPDESWQVDGCTFSLSRDIGHEFDVGVIYIYSQCRNDLFLYSYDETIGLGGFSLLKNSGEALYVYRLVSGRGFVCHVEREGVSIQISDCDVEHLET